MTRDGAKWRSWRRIFRRDPADEVDEELRHHVEQRTRDYIERGMDPESARAAARKRLGDLQRVKDDCTRLLSADRRARDRSLRLQISWLDVKLGVRMLRKYPGLSLVSVIGMAVAIAIGTGYFAGFGAVLDPALPLDDGDRIVGLRYRDVDRPGNDAEVSVHDYHAWRATLRSVRDLSAFRSQRRNLITESGRIELIEVAAITASGLGLPRVAPALGRPLLEEDERASAAPVLVIAHEEWQRVFDGDPDILGRTVRLGETVHTVVGVMPAGFRFPVNHRYWVPLRLDATAGQAGGAPSLLAFGRLKDGVTVERARAELTTIGERMAAAFPATHAQLRPVVMPYTHAMFGMDGPEVELAVRAIQLAVSLLLVIVALNVAVLVYARTVTRTGEIAVRSALGASRRRVVAQLFVEALILSGAASAIGLTLAGIALGLANAWIRRTGELSFWIHFGLSPSAVVYVVLLAIVAAAIVGVLPALKATGKQLQQGLQQFSSRGSGMELGRTWSALIVVQVAAAVAILPWAANYAERSARIGTRGPAAVAHALLRATLVMSGDAASPRADSAARERAFQARFADRAAELTRRIERQPEVTGVIFASHFPGTEPYASLEVEDGPARVGVRTSRVGSDFFRVLDIPILAGRTFVAADTREGAAAVIVSESLAHRIAGGASVLGRRIRPALRDGGSGEGSWLEIVGVVPDFAHDFQPPNSFDPVMPRLYHALAVGQVHPAVLAVRVRGGPPAGFAARLRDITAAVDPTLTLDRLETAADRWATEQRPFAYLALGVVAVTLSVLLLSAAGIHAMMSFTVARRRREIGIRSALGADPRRLLTAVFARAAAQLGTGLVAGLALVILADVLTHGTLVGDRAPLLLPAVAVVMVAVGLLAALGPARRGLAIEPVAALREE